MNPIQIAHYNMQCQIFTLKSVILLINLLNLYYKFNIYKMSIMYCIINVMHLKKT